MIYNNNLLKMVFKIQLISYFSVLVAFCVAQDLLHAEKKFDTIQGAVFSEKAYPKSGDIPVLNRKVFRAAHVRAHEHPYVASIRRLHAHYLTGAIISHHVVITVAHPIYNVPSTELGVVVGEAYSDRGSVYNSVPLLLTHKDFNPRTLLADVALLRLYNKLVVKPTQKPIPIFNNFNSMLKNTPENAFVAGWGRCDWIGTELCLPRSSVYFPDEKQDPILRTISFNHNRLQESPYCIGYQKDQLYVARHRGMLCVGVAREEEPLAACLAVPGAPLTIGGMLVGLLSWGFGCGYTNDLPLIYTDIRYFHDWINDSVTKLEGLNQRHIAELFIAGKAYVIEEWLSQTIEQQPGLAARPDPPLRAAEVDGQLVYLEGNVTDFRDYAFEGKFQKAKADIYEILRAQSNDKQKLQEIYSKHMMTTSSRPFLHTYSVYD